MLVSAIMPTRGRQQYAREALECFLSQTWPDKELVILDDADDPSFPSGVDLPNVQYHLLTRRLTVGAKRNMACSRASGGDRDVIAHFDSDDFSAPQRIEDQATRLIDRNVQITGFHSMRFLHVASGEWWKYRGASCYSLGTALMYTREFWKAHPFPDVNVGEDNHVTSRAGKIASVDAGEMMWARTHAGCTDSRDKFGKADCWVKVA